MPPNLKLVLKTEKFGYLEIDMTFAELEPGAMAEVTHVGGRGSFRRRLLELGILPGSRLQMVGVAPFGDPLELLVRGASLSIRRAEAELVEVKRTPQPEKVLASDAPDLLDQCARGGR
jgi:ferrous iron transport protein A